MRPITDLDELKKIELEILKQVHAFCEEKDISYCLAYGTLLGAIRHNGFIPWDDDIDIHMTRDEYERFIREFPEWGAKRNLYIAGPHSKEHFFPRNMVKVCDGRTALVERSFKKRKPMGAFIDIWPLDKFPEKGATGWMKLVDLFKNLTLYSDMDVSSDHYRSFPTKKRLRVWIISKTSTRLWLYLMERLTGKYNHLQAGYKYICIQATESIYSAKSMEKMLLHRFEDSAFYIPCGYDEILTVKYGDYMQLPPEHLRQPHHDQDVWWI